MTSSILIVEARFYAHISDMLLDGATAAIEKAGAHFERLSVPGALEIPTAIALAARSGEHGGKSFDGFVALGCVIRGETYHFEIVASESARGLLDLGINNGLCIGNGILTVESEKQALVRAAVDDGDKGGDAARACLSLINIRNRLGVHR
ncbi:MAG TPA: 6,7-dimethyl-8-ribityllumazine synthase [Rhizomicrobium sp.]|nr:6,7-dimethyl-8-ribityllumazine synthase [Rhizomicrobium sp.]